MSRYLFILGIENLWQFVLEKIAKFIYPTCQHQSQSFRVQHCIGLGRVRGKYFYHGRLFVLYDITHTEYQKANSKYHVQY